MRQLLSTLAVAALAVVVVLAAGVFSYKAYRDYLSDPGPAAGPTTVVLPRGVGLGEIIHRLDGAGVIDRPWLFQLAVRLGGHDRALKAGEYAFPARASPARVLEMLAAGEIVIRKITVAEGLTVAEVYDLLEHAEGLTGDPPAEVAEGSLLPETYNYSLGDSRAELVARMQNAMTRTLNELWAKRDPDLPFTSPAEALTMASIVDKETGLAHERTQVAAVFVNRLRQGMKLQSDPTIIYALTGGRGPLNRPLNRQDWKFDSPYNTYRVVGLPPGPIGNPGRESIGAVMRPAEVDYLYFVANGTGGHAFSRSLDEHNRHVFRWQKIRAGELPPPIPPSPAKPADPPNDRTTAGDMAIEPAFNSIEAAPSPKS